MAVMTIYNGDKQHYDFFYGPKSFVTIPAGGAVVVPGITSAAQAASIALAHSTKLQPVGSTKNTGGTTALVHYVFA